MTEPDDDHSSTRPISVAELLAKNGTIGAPPVGGRRRRRRGNSESVTVAELTGEIPIVTDTTKADTTKADTTKADTTEADTTEADTTEADTAAPSEQSLGSHDVEEAAELAEPDDRPVAAAPTNGAAGSSAPAPVRAPLPEVEADYASHLEQRDADPAPIEFVPPPRRPHVVTPTGFSAPAGSAEQMSPDPLDDDDDEDDDHLTPLGLETVDDAAVGAQPASSEMRSYLRSSSDTLFGGQSVADDLARRGRQPGPEDIDLGDDDAASDAAPKEVAEERGSTFLRGVWVVAQCILAVLFGAGLFIAFDQLWRWNSIVALVLGVLVILGLVVGVRVVRKTEDIGSTLIAVAVGAMVTLGPLALLQAH
jgi:hypothetical protein